MNILLIVSWYKTLDSPMIGSFFEEQARALIKKGHNVSILYPEFLPYSSSLKSKNEIYNDKGIVTFHYVFKAKVPKNRIINYHFFRKELYQFYSKSISPLFTPDIIHAHTVFYGGIIADYLSTKTRTPFILTEHFTKFITNDITNKRDLKYAKNIYKRSSKNIIVSNGFKDLLAKKLNLNKNLFTVIPNMVNSIFFEDSPIEINNNKFPTFFTVSFLTPRKNHVLILESFALFLQKVPNAKLKIGGNGPMKDELIKHSENLGINQNVIFLGELSREMVANELANTDIFILASTFETFGVVLIEALAKGVPILSTDSVGPRDIVNSFNGILTTSFKKEDFYKSMITMYNNYSNFNKNQIKQDCFNRFSEYTVIKQILEIYESIEFYIKPKK